METENTGDLGCFHGGPELRKAVDDFLKKRPDLQLREDLHKWTLGFEQALQYWKWSRNITTDSQKEVVLDNIKEELQEYKEAKTEHDRLDAMLDVCVLALNAINRFHHNSSLVINKDISSLEPYDSAMEIIFFKSPDTELETRLFAAVYTTTVYVEAMGYDFTLAFSEVIKEISSRRQDPEQKAKWDKYFSENGKYPDEKWLKDKNQPESEKYKADFTHCRIYS